jgi:hypothetical protein
MVSSHQLYSWNHGPLYLSIQHHDLFSPIPYMRPGTTLSAYATIIGEKRPWWCIDRYSGPWSHVCDWWEETMMLYREIEWFLVSCIENRDHSICLFNTMVSSHQFYSWDQGPLYLPIQHHGLFSPIPYMRTGTTLSVYATPWSLLTNSIHETRDHSICLYNTMVSSHQSHTWEQGHCWWEETMVMYRQIEWSLVSCMWLVRRDHDVV